MKPIAKITLEETEKLRFLYEQANKTDDQVDRQKLKDFLDQLGEKYQYEPQRVGIDTKGNVNLLSEEIVFVVIDIQQNNIVKVFQSKKKAMTFAAKSPIKYNVIEVELV